MVRLICLIILSFFVETHAQENLQNMFSPNDQTILESMKIDVSIFRDFQMSSEDNMECFETEPMLSDAFSCINNKQISKDGDCVAFMPLHRIFGTEDSLFFNKFARTDIQFSPNSVHHFNFKRQVSSLQQSNLDWTSALAHLPFGKAKELCNADSVIYFHKRMEAGDYYEDRYDSVLSVMLHKKNRGFVNIIFFYEDRSRFNVAILLNLIKEHIVYRN